MSLNLCIEIVYHVCENLCQKSTGWAETSPAYPGRKVRVRLRCAEPPAWLSISCALSACWRGRGSRCAARITRAIDPPRGPAESLCQALVSELPLALAAPGQMSEVVQDIEHPLLTVCSDHADRGVRRRKKEIFLQAQRLGSIGVNDAPMSKDEHPLAPMAAGNLINSHHHPPAKLLRGLAAGNRIPVAGAAGQAHNLRLPRLQGPGQPLQIMLIGRQRKGIAQVDLLNIRHERERQPQMLQQRSRRLLASAQRTAVCCMKTQGLQAFGQGQRLLAS